MNTCTGTISAIGRVVIVVAVVCVLLPASAQQRDAGATAIQEAALRVAPKGVVPTSFKERPKGVLVVGRAKRHEDVSDFMRSLAGLVSTPRGLGRVVERAPGGRTARVELFEAEGRSTTVDFAAAEISPFAIELRRADPARDDKNAHLDFEIDVHAK